MERVDMIYDLMLEQADTNAREHRDIMEKLKEVDSQVLALRLWKSRIIGSVIGVSTLISIGGWLFGHLLGK